MGACGAGNVFDFYERAAARLGNVEFAAVADPDHTKLTTRRKSGRILVTDFRDLLNEQLDAVVILSPHHLHASQAMSAFRKGIPVLCEKPLATSISEARQAIALAATQRVRLQVAMHCRFRPEIEFIYKHIDGPVVRFEQRYLENWTSAGSWFFDPRTSGGGVLLDVGINQIDWLLPLLDGLTPARATFDCCGSAVEQEGTIHWRWKNGCGTTQLSWRADREEKITIIETEPGTRFELNHQNHSALVNGALRGPWTCEEYEGVLAAFLSGFGEPPASDLRALRVLELLGETYRLAGLPFLND